MSLDKLFAGTDELHVGKRIGKGGEGEVYALANLPGYAVKAYLPTVVASREAKIRAMVDASLHSSINTVAFPTKVVADRKGSFVGFLMRLVAEHKEIHELQTPSSRLKHFPSADYRFLVRTAINVARVFGQVHAAGCVIGDINQRSILVSQQATVALIDTDSFQVIQKGKQYLCVVGVPEYTPPELQGQSLKYVVRTPDHDAFGLAVAIFQLLCMDRHPFSGRFKGAGDMGIEQAIKEFRFAYSMRDTKMQPPPSTVQMEDLSPKVRQSFELAFSPQCVGSRPTPSEWISALEDLEQSLRPCTNNKAHHYSRVAAECPWCRMEQAFGVPMFISHDANAHHVPKGSISEGVGFNFNVVAIEAILNSLTVPGQIKVAIPAPKITYKASVGAVDAASKKSSDRMLRKLGAAGMGALAVFLFASGISPIVPLIAGGIGLYLALRSDSTESLYRQKFNGTAEKLRARVQHLQSNSPAETVQATRAAILEKIDEYKALVSDFKNIETDYNASRRQQQLDAHLSAHGIRGARIPKLTSGDVASLASYGFTTAYDASKRDVQDAHGIGPVKSANIMAWVNQMERKFLFRTTTLLPIEQRYKPNGTISSPGSKDVLTSFRSLSINLSSNTSSSTIGSLAKMSSSSNSSRNWPRPRLIYDISKSRFQLCSRYLRINLPSIWHGDRPPILRLPVLREQASEATTIQAEPAQAYSVARYVVPACACGQQDAESGRGGSFGDAAVIRPARVLETFEVEIRG